MARGERRSSLPNKQVSVEKKKMQRRGREGGGREEHYKTVRMYVYVCVYVCVTVYTREREEEKKNYDEG